MGAVAKPANTHSGKRMSFIKYVRDGDNVTHIMFHCGICDQDRTLFVGDLVVKPNLNYNYIQGYCAGDRAWITGHKTAST